jgi:hypothetical protein
MRIALFGFGLALLALPEGCNPAASSPQRVQAPNVVFTPAKPSDSLPPPSAMPSSEMAPPQPPAAQACSPTLLQYQMSELDRARKKSKLTNEALKEFDLWLPASQGEPPHLLCASSWALVVKSFTLASTSPRPQKAACNKGDGLCVTFALAHESQDGTVQEQAIALKYAFSFDMYTHFQPTKTLAYDFDGDGSAEWLMIAEKWEHESTAEHILVGFSFRSGAIVPFATPADAYPEEFRDVDGDGRPDLVGHLHYSSDQLISCGSGFQYRLSGPEFMWHSTFGGKFDAADDAAKAFALKGCGTKPEIGKVFPRTMKVVKTPEGAEYEARYSSDELAARGLCAQMWGVSAADVKKEMTLTPGLNGGKCDTGEFVPTGSQERTVLRQWLSKPPPFLF